MTPRDEALMRAAIFDVLDSPLPWVFRSNGDELQRLEFADAVQKRVVELERMRERA